jgi:hypothetical protein
MGLYLGRKQITFGLIASTTEKITKVLKNHERIGFLAYEVWQSLDKEFFRRLQAGLQNKKEAPKPRLPRPHQKKALQKAFEYFSNKANTRGKLIMPCGTGKSLTSYYIARGLKPRSILIAVPSLSLIKQTLKEWMREFIADKIEVKWICVCSDESAGTIEQDDVSILPQDLGVPCFTNIKKIRNWLLKNKNTFNIVFTTYQSSKVLSLASKQGGISYDLAVFDEAHKTVGSKGKLFSFLLDDANINIKRRLFMTATEKYYSGNNDEILSMDDPKNYGDTIYNLTFKKALDSRPPILCDYQVLTVYISEEELAELVKKRAFIDAERINVQTDAETIVSLIALRKAIKTYPIKHAVSFHGSIKRAKKFALYNSRYSVKMRTEPELESFHVSGQTPAGSRARILYEFSKANRALITNARCLTEGVDVPNIDAILFADPRKSLVDIVQAVGRALRPYPGKRLGYIIVPVVHSKKDTVETLLESESFKRILLVLSALASQDERLVEYFRSITGNGHRSLGGIFNIDINVKHSKKIEIKKLVNAINLRIWKRLAKLSWRPFNEARSFIHMLELNNVREWGEFCRGKIIGKYLKPDDIPSSPQIIYKKRGWRGFSDWLGKGRAKKLFHRSGKDGGTKKSTLKTLVSRQNILLRWNPRGRNGAIPMAALINGGWYRGMGENGSIAMWDLSKNAFITINLKQKEKKTSKQKADVTIEKHVSLSGGTFFPDQIVG